MNRNSTEPKENHAVCTCTGQRKNTRLNSDSIGGDLLESFVEQNGGAGVVDMVVGRAGLGQIAVPLRLRN